MTGTATWVMTLVVVLALWLTLSRTKGEDGGSFPAPLWDWRRWRDVIYSASGVAPEDQVARALFNAPVGDGITREIVTGLAWDESGFRPEATGSAGEVGLMQLTEGALRDVERLRHLVGATGFTARPDRLSDPEYAVPAATYYLRLLRTHYMQAYGAAQLERVKGNVDLLTLAWYKAGPGNLTEQGLEYGARALAKVQRIRDESRDVQAEVASLGRH